VVPSTKWVLQTSWTNIPSFFYLNIGGWSPNWVHSALLVPAPGDCDDGEVGGMNGFGRGNRSTQRKPARMPLCPPQIPLARSEQEPGPLQWEASDWPLQPWRGPNIPSYRKSNFFLACNNTHWNNCVKCLIFMLMHWQNWGICLTNGQHTSFRYISSNIKQNATKLFNFTKLQ
jgi:hypothetical protein